MPRKIVSGEHATLAVLDVSGRLTPGVHVEFSNGDTLKTDTTGRAMFVAPLNAEKICMPRFRGRVGKVASTVVTAVEISFQPPTGSRPRSPRGFLERPL